MASRIFYTLIFSLIAFVVSGQDWELQESAPTYKGKQDDIYFINTEVGWYVNGSGQIFHTKNGGKDWAKIYEKPGTFFRCIGFVDSLTGFVGNIGTEYFPNVSDTVPLYKTNDGGKTWEPVQYSGPVVKGLCAIEIVKVPYINHGKLDHKVHIYAGGRVGTPAYLLTSKDGGKSWISQDMNDHCSFILDIKFMNENEGIICAGIGSELSKMNALILKTKDGGKSWKKVYQSDRPYEITWKGSFPSDSVGYVTLQSYNPDTTVSKRYIIKTTDRGESWQELLLVDDYRYREFGIGFMDNEFGWVGTNGPGFETKDGGKTWEKVDLGKYVNKIRIVGEKNKKVAYSIGSTVYKYD